MALGRDVSYTVEVQYVVLAKTRVVHGFAYAFNEVVKCFVFFGQERKPIHVNDGQLVLPNFWVRFVEKPHEDVQKLHGVHWQVHVAVVEPEHVLRNLDLVGVVRLFNKHSHKLPRVHVERHY